jgi:hypothetical protein
MTTSTARVEPDDQDIAISWRPLALHANKAVIEVEQHVVATALADGTVDVDAELRRLKDDRLLGDLALLIRRQHNATDATVRIGWAVS